MKALVRLLLIAVALTLTPARAWAECAWVLWEETTLREGNRVTARDPLAPARGYKEKEDCEQAVAKVYASSPDGWTKQVVGAALVFRSGDMTLIKTAKCLPDTIDPRGPKGALR